MIATSDFLEVGDPSLGTCVLASTTVDVWIINKKIAKQFSQTLQNQVENGSLQWIKQVLDDMHGLVIGETGSKSGDRETALNSGNPRIVDILWRHL